VKPTKNDMGLKVYEDNKKKMEKYHRNIFEFSVNLNILSVLVVLMAIAFAAVVVAYIIHKLVEIEQ